MPTVLHLLKDAHAPLALATIAQQLAAGDTVVVAVLNHAPPRAVPAGVTVHHIPSELSYAELLDLVFTADHVIAW